MEDLDISKPRILVLLDLKQNSEIVLSQGAQLAKKLKGDLQVLHVRPPLEAIGQDNQLSAKREFYEHYESTKEQLEMILESAFPNSANTVNYNLLYGNVRNVILEVMEQQQPDVVVLGKRTSKLGGLLGDRVTGTVLDVAEKAIFIADDNAKMDNLSEVSAGFLQDEDMDAKDTWRTLVENETKKVNYFGLVSGNIEPEENESRNNQFLFSAGSNVIDNIVTYAEKTNTTLFHIPKTAIRNKAGYPFKMIQKLKANIILS